MPLEQTFGLIKSAAMNRNPHAIWQRIRAAGLHIEATRYVGTKDNEADLGLFEALYESHAGKPYYAGLIASVARESIAHRIIGENAVQAFRKLIGPTDPAVARATDPMSLRAMFGGEALPDNAVHGSANPKEAARELAIFFPTGRAA